MIKNLLLIFALIVLCNFTNSIKLMNKLKHHQDKHEEKHEEKGHQDKKPCLCIRKLKNSLTKVKMSLMAKKNNYKFYTEMVAKWFLKGDKDGDGYLSLEEITNFLNRIYEKNQLEKIPQQNIERKFNELDTNDDGKLSFEEVLPIVGTCLENLKVRLSDRIEKVQKQQAEKKDMNEKEKKPVKKE